MTSTARRRHRGLGATLAVVALVVLLVLPEAADGSRLRLAAAPGDPTAPLVIGTVPAVTGFPVILDGVTVVTDLRGKATFPSVPLSDRPLTDRVSLNEAVLPLGGQEVLVRADRLYPSLQEPLLALDQSYLVSFRFTGVRQAPVAPSSIEAFTVKSETGEIVDVRPGEDTWLQGTRVVKRTGLMEVKELRWSVQQVEFAGSNVVNASQQFFYPAQQRDVEVRLLFFGLDVQVHDAMFGFAQGGAIDLVYPDGRSRRFPLDDAGHMSLPELPRGDYTLTIVGPGPPMSRPLAVSRDQSIELAFHSWLDILTVLSAVLGAVGALAWMGRIRRRRDTDDDLAQGAATAAVPTRPRLAADAPVAEPATDEHVVHTHHRYGRPA